MGMLLAMEVVTSGVQKSGWSIVTILPRCENWTVHNIVEVTLVMA